MTCEECVDPRFIESFTTNAHGIPIDVLAHKPIQALSEKLRAILQKHRHYSRRRAVGNFNPRHLFNLIPLTGMVAPEDWPHLPEHFAKRCAAREVTLGPGTRQKFFEAEFLQAAQTQDPRLAAKAIELLPLLLGRAGVLS